MNVHHPKPILTLTDEELTAAVQVYFESLGYPNYLVGHIKKVDLHQADWLNGDSYHTGRLTFELTSKV